MFDAEHRRKTQKSFSFMFLKWCGTHICCSYQPGWRSQLSIPTLGSQLRMFCVQHTDLSEMFDKAALSGCTSELFRLTSRARSTNLLLALIKFSEVCSVLLLSRLCLRLRCSLSSLLCMCSPPAAPRGLALTAYQKEQFDWSL